jgi:hypothetical protein
MSISLELPKEVEAQLSAEAARLGLSVSEYAIRVLSLSHSSQEKPRNGAELIVYWQRYGLIGSRPDIGDSQEHSRQVRAEAERRGGV